ncbi:2-oxoacid:ferredoxin oxidoreductase subunit beta [candidate division WOR-3 bacterium]|uniref:2-oxoacid:ferredoxin oxidoreductase subunit beta n=1 Tax=candidate division WOR-3 bacterium TaxID=2052148 RepID=A0A660SLD6_UNCW3|nr:MAG: 2-oxoacid:ferredoxin oxidoreductase subunit beta [candidate division WOR-3 bacterium]
MKIEHPMEDLLRMDRIPHIWCPGCGIGTAVTAFIAALKKVDLDLDKVCVVSGIGCSGRIAGYIKLDSFHTTHGRAIPFATGLKLGNPELQVVVMSGDGDLVAIGGNHFIHAARRNLDLLVICINNFNYAMTGGQVAPTTPILAKTTTTPYGNFEYPFNIPYLADACGAVYVARWTVLHIRRLTDSIAEALTKKGFRVIEVISPCATIYARRNRLGSGIDLMKFYHDNAEIRHFEDTRNVEIGFQTKIICGKFIDRERPTFLESINKGFEKVLGEKYVKVGGKS